MARQFSRRGVSSQRQYDVEVAQEYEKTKSAPRPIEQPLDGKRQNTDRIIADMAQGFVQAQADITGKSANSTNQEMLSLLQKVSTQLEKMQQPTQSGSADKKTLQSEPAQKTQVQSQQSQEGQENKTGSQSEKQPTESMVSQELQNLFSQILQGKDEKNSTQQSNNQNTNAKPQKKDKDAAMTVQTAAQVLAQAQYELSNELEASLKKLKQVISESEKIATKISDLLGEENK
jgi:myosin heavy subunit